ncbi:hypothetical protein [Ferruginibacter sp. HRS2-29]|uniref:hypothetical protein n=1 Tax=Ferruginibacter sp. HRS2-29 TaxID=2487334 RepID=UPI0020CDF1F9|nr:hypothetical protein [Ferruginibacter sp. HRS2-29]MCP9751392.1 hypothetical protein [Ferruginibacter sp. HRS2-29]
MTPVEFLKNELNTLATSFPNVHIKYGYNNVIDTHIVELLPLIEYSSNQDLDKAWVPLSINFMEKFKNEEIAFISSDSSLSLKHVIFEFNPKACTEENVLTELYQELAKNELEYSFPTQIPQLVVFDTFASLKKSKKTDQVEIEENECTSYSIAA